MDAFTFGSNLYGVYETAQATNYYFFFSGQQIGSTLVDTVQLADLYFNFLDVKIMPQWKRYRGTPLVWDQWLRDLTSWSTHIDSIENLLYLIEKTDRT